MEYTAAMSLEHAIKSIDNGISESLEARIKLALMPHAESVVAGYASTIKRL